MYKTTSKGTYGSNSVDSKERIRLKNKNGGMSTRTYLNPYHTPGKVEGSFTGRNARQHNAHRLNLFRSLLKRLPSPNQTQSPLLKGRIDSLLHGGVAIVAYNRHRYSQNSAGTPLIKADIALP